MFTISYATRKQSLPVTFDCRTSEVPLYEELLRTDASIRQGSILKKNGAVVWDKQEQALFPQLAELRLRKILRDAS